MRARVLRFATIAAVALLTGGCVTAAEWTAWRAHAAHFASFEPMGFSLRNREGSAPRVRRRDLEEARAQHWWGDPITVGTAQILER